MEYELPYYDWKMASVLINEVGKKLQAEHGDTYGMALWLQEYYCSFEAAIPGAIWGSQTTKIVLENGI